MNISINNLGRAVAVPIRRTVVPRFARLSRIYSVRETTNILGVDFVTLVELTHKAKVWPVSFIVGHAYSGVQVVMLHLARGGYAEIWEGCARLHDSN